MEKIARMDKELAANRDLLNAVKDTIAHLAPGSQVILYGSRARAMAEPDSDFDLLVIVPGSIDSVIEETLNNVLYAIELEHGVVLSTLIYAKQTWDHPLYQAHPFHRVVDREGILL